jgi:predicted dehydrogenase
MQEVKIGIIGSGGRGNVLRHVHCPGEGVRVVACCDLDEEALAKNREAYGDDLFVTKDYRELLAHGIDAVSVGSPDFLHEEHACAALERGVATFLEKPMHITIAGCDRILQTARQSGTKLFVGHNMRYMSLFIEMKRLIDSGAIGEVKAIWCRHFVAYGGDAYFRDWHSERRYANSLLLQKGAHDIDMIHWLAGRYTRRVSAFGSLTVYDKCARRSPEEKGDTTWKPEHWPPLEQKDMSPIIDVEDQSVVIMDMGDGVMGSYLQCHFTPDAARNYTVIGTEGRIENVDDCIFLWNRRMLEWESHKRALNPDKRFDDTRTSGADHGGADPVMTREFVAYVRGDVTETTATPGAARMAVAVGCRASDSLRGDGGALNVPPLPDASPRD